jgi:hypothetical protein
MICDKREAIFIHIPRTGGTSVEISMTGHSWHGASRHFEQHLTLKQAKLLYGRKIEEFTTFTIVRNPFDLLISMYKWGQAVWQDVGMERLRDKLFNNTKEVGAFLMRRTLCEFLNVFPLSPKPSFSEFIRDVRKYQFFQNFNEYGADMTQQAKCLTGDADVPQVEIIRFENLEEEYKKLCEAHDWTVEPITQTNSTLRKPYREVINDDDRKYIEQHWADDLETFGYSF